MICDSVFGKIISADSVASIAASEFALALLQTLRVLLASLQIVETRTQNAQRLGEVFVLASFILTADDTEALLPYLPEERI